MALEALHSAKFTTASGHARANCPFCEGRVGKADRKQCLGIHRATGWFKCWRCGIKGRINDEEYVPPPEPAEKPDRPPMAPPEGFYELAREPGRSALSLDDARDYLRSRGFTDESVWKACRLGATVSGKYNNRLVIPVLSPRDEWWGWVARDLTGHHEKKYLNAPGMTLGSDGNLFNHSALLIETETPALVMEGGFDALAYWPDGVAVLGSPTDEQMMSLAMAPRPIVFVPDGDAWRSAWANAMKLRLDKQRAGFVKLPPGKDPDEVDRDWVRAEARESLHAD